MSNVKNITLVFALLLGYAGCIDDDIAPVESTTPYELKIPVGFPDMTIPKDNTLTKEGVQLGRRLYYDKILERDNSRACATCHVQAHSFSSDTNVLPHINLGWSRNFLWNSKVSGSVEDIMLFEVEEFFKTDFEKLNNDPEYSSLFKKAFNVDQITSTEASYALAQFVRTMISGNSKFDKFLRGEVTFTNEEYLGYELFYTEEGDCFHCHATMFFTDNSMHNNALDSIPDPGYFEITGDSADYGKFKSPTLRNIAFTGPYMHDGRFNSLEEVVDFYSRGLERSATVDPLMKNLASGGIQLSAGKKAALVAFLKTLSDEDFLNNPELSDPFN